MNNLNGLKVNWGLGVRTSDLFQTNLKINYHYPSQYLYPLHLIPTNFKVAIINTTLILCERTLLRVRAHCLILYIYIYHYFSFSITSTSLIDDKNKSNDNKNNIVVFALLSKSDDEVLSFLDRSSLVIHTTSIRCKRASAIISSSTVVVVWDLLRRGGGTRRKKMEGMKRWERCDMGGII